MCEAAARLVVKPASLRDLLQQLKKGAALAPAGLYAAPHGERWPPQSHKTRRSAPRPAAPVARPLERLLRPPNKKQTLETPRRSPGACQPPNTMVRDLLHPSASEEKRKHKLKRLVQSPNSFFMDVKCPGCFNITTVFSHAQTTVLCGSCSMMLCQPTGGKARLTEGCSFRKKLD